MPFALWVAAGSFLLAGVAVLAVMAPRWLIALPAIGLVAFTTWAVASAETPFGIGNGVVPDVVGRDSECDALTALEERGLRWLSFGDLYDRVPARLCDVDEDVSYGSGAPTGIVDQRPEPGTDLGEGGVVRLIRECERP